MSQLMRNLLNERRKRMIASVMNYLETEVYPKLTDPERQRLRDVVQGAVRSYHEVCLDLLKASVTDGSVVNEEALRAINALHDDVRRELRALNGRSGG